MARMNDLKPDENGRYRPRIGWVIDTNGKRTQPRFNLGKNRAEAERRYRRIHDLLADNSRHNAADALWLAGPDVWSPRFLRWAEQIAAGVPVIPIPPPANEKRALVEYQQGIEHYRAEAPSLTFAPSEPIVFAESAKLNSDYVSQRIDLLEAELKKMGALLI